MNTYIKFCPNVFVAKCHEQHLKGDTITVTTQHGKEHECTVWNFVGKTKDGHFCYSITRNDGFNRQEYIKKKAERYTQWATAAEKKKYELIEASNEGRDFLSLGEPIKVGHHSEKRHRALIQRNHDRMGRAIEQETKSAAHADKAEYWSRRTDEINLSMPEAIEFYEFKVEEAKMRHEGLRSGTIARDHSFSLPYAKKAVNEAVKNLDLAKRLWAE